MIWTGTSFTGIGVPAAAPADEAVAPLEGAADELPEDRMACFQFKSYMLNSVKETFTCCLFVLCRTRLSGCLV